MLPSFSRMRANLALRRLYASNQADFLQWLKDAKPASSTAGKPDTQPSRFGTGRKDPQIRPATGRGSPVDLDRITSLFEQKPGPTRTPRGAGGFGAGRGSTAGTNLSHKMETPVLGQNLPPSLKAALRDMPVATPAADGAASKPPRTEVPDNVRCDAIQRHSCVQMNLTTRLNIFAASKPKVDTAVCYAVSNMHC